MTDAPPAIGPAHTKPLRFAIFCNFFGCFLRLVIGGWGHGELRGAAGGLEVERTTTAGPEGPQAGAGVGNSEGRGWERR